MIPGFIDSPLFNWVILPLLIFLARTCDVTLATLRNIFLSKNIRKLVPLLGFFEAAIWLMAISQIVRNLHHPLSYLAFAAGYSMGIFVGIKIEERLALGKQMLRIITHQDPSGLIEKLKANSFGTTVINAAGSTGPVKIILTVIHRKDLPVVAAIINEHNPNAFYSVEDIRLANQGIFPRTASESFSDYLKRLFPWNSKLF
jgi:uncharacterized protein YebE (UPF0316 family)